MTPTTSCRSCCFSLGAGAGATSSNNLTTNLYHTRLGIFALTWSKTSLNTISVDIHHLHLHLRLTFSPLLFWNNHGSKQLYFPSSTATLLWNFSNPKSGSKSPEPDSGFFIAILLGSETILHIGDLNHPKSKPASASLVVRREHVQGAKRHVTKTSIGGKTRAISIDCEYSDPDPRLVIRIDDKKFLQVKHLRWKFRGSEKIEVDGHPILISWDVYNWLFDDCEKGEGFALFTFRFETDAGAGVGGERVLLSEEVPSERGWRKKKGLMAKTKSSSSSELSSASASASSSACGSVLEWESVEETELKGPTGFSLLVYAWKR